MHTETATADFTFVELSFPTFAPGEKVTYSGHGATEYVAYVVRQNGSQVLLSTSHPDVAVGTRHTRAAFTVRAAR